MKHKLRKGKILISEPYIQDDNFFRSVILLANYDKENGAVGFMLNQITYSTLNDIIEGEELPPLSLYEGGPVQMDSLFFLHSIEDLKSTSLEIKEDLYWGSNFEEIVPLIKDGSITSNEIKIFVGYSGWASGQLEEEVQSGSWFVSNLRTKDILETGDDVLWKYTVQNLDSKNKIWANAPLDPLLN